MNKIKQMTLAAACLMALWGCDGNKAAGDEAGDPNGGVAVTADGNVTSLNGHQDSVSYSIGMDIGRNFSQQGIEVNMPAMVQGLKDGMAGGQTLIDEQTSRMIMMNFQRELQMKAQQEMAAASSANLAKAQQFLAENGKRPNVKTTPSGLQYEVLKEGTGASPTLQDQVMAHYHGTLLDGTVFDSSVERGQPATFALANLIPAWKEMIPMMKEGGKVKLYCPPNLAYGERGSPPKIGANEGLIFEIELIQVIK